MAESLYPHEAPLCKEVGGSYTRVLKISLNRLIRQHHPPPPLETTALTHIAFPSGLSGRYARCILAGAGAGFIPISQCPLNGRSD